MGVAAITTLGRGVHLLIAILSKSTSRSSVRSEETSAEHERLSRSMYKEPDKLGDS